MNKPYVECEFLLGDIFDIHAPAKKFNANTVKFGGLYPYVARGSSNNGIRGYITEDTKYLNPARTFSFGQDTATVYYQEKAYFTGDKIKVMELRGHELNETIALYLIPVIRKAFSGFAWGQSSFNESVLNNMKIYLPVTSDGTPDWDYMSERVRELEEERVRELDAYLKVSGLDDYELTEEDKAVLSLSEKTAFDEAGVVEHHSEIRWKEFTLDELFAAEKGDIDLQQKDINDKGCFFINSGVDNQGIKGRTDRPAKVFTSNTITIDFWGNAYYRDFEYKLATHNHVFSLSGDIIKNREVGLYLVGRMAGFPKLFSYSNMATWPKLKELSILLPVKDNGAPDFDYMERYIRAIEKCVIANVIKWKDDVIAATKTAIA